MATCPPAVYLDQEVERALMHRLSRIEGQVRGIERMLEGHESCDEILVQLAALKSAVNGAARQLLEGHMQTCVLESVRAGSGEEAFRRLNDALDQFLRHT
jgi:DNA-binding FrmR family transcriptional regulator